MERIQALLLADRKVKPGLLIVHVVLLDIVVSVLLCLGCRSNLWNGVTRQSRLSLSILFFRPQTPNNTEPCTHE